MALRSIVKVSHLSNLSDARYCAGMGVDMLGFDVLPESDSYMPPDIFQEIRGWIAGPRIVAELYGVKSREEIETAIRTYAPDALELSFEEYQRFHEFLRLPCLTLVSHPSQIKETSEICPSHFIIPEQFDYSSIEGITRPVLMRVTSLESLKQNLGKGGLAGFVLEGPGDMQVGVTNYDKLGALLELLEED